MKTNPPEFLFIVAGFLALGMGASWAAKAPIGDEDRKKEASHIVTGKLVSSTSKVQKSTVEKAVGIHRDKVFTMKVKVETVRKGKGIKKGNEIRVLA